MGSEEEITYKEDFSAVWDLNTISSNRDVVFYYSDVIDYEGKPGCWVAMTKTGIPKEKDLTLSGLLRKFRELA